MAVENPDGYVHMIEEVTYLTNQFLIAMPMLADPNFFQTVTYISEHNSRGALGMVINRPSQFSIRHLLEYLNIKTDRPDLASLPVYHGGPVQPEQGFVIHSPVGQWKATLNITNQIGITTSRDILQAVACREGPEHMLVTLGYAGWGPGQLEQEFVNNAWLSTPSDFDILFCKPSSQRWLAAASLLGVDLNLLSANVGHS
jgi:putative transcriptional regulator